MEGCSAQFAPPELLSDCGSRLERRDLRGVSEGWAAPTCLFVAREAMDIHAPGAPQLTLSLHVSGASLERLDDPSWRGRAATPRTFTFGMPEPSVWRAHGPGVLRQIYFSPGLVTPLSLELLDEPKPTWRDNLFHFYDGELLTLVSAYADRAGDTQVPATTVEMDARAALICAHLIRTRAVAKRAPSQARHVGIVQWRLRKVLALIEERLTDDVRLKDLAAEAGLSLFHFVRAFRDTMGETPHRYLQRRRVERACVLLHSSNIPIAEIAVKCGFPSHSHFSSTFRAIVGVSPRQFREDR